MYYHDFNFTLITEEQMPADEAGQMLDDVLEAICGCNGDPDKCRIAAGSSRANMTEEQFEELLDRQMQ